MSKKMYSADLPMTITESGDFIKPTIYLTVDNHSNNSLSEGWLNSMCSHWTYGSGPINGRLNYGAIFKPINEDV